MNPLRWLSALLLALALVAGAALWLQRQAAAALRDEIVLLREENREIARLRAERKRLVAAQVSAAELVRLRADREAVTSMRSEIEALKESVAQRERALAGSARQSETAAPATPRSPPLMLPCAVGADGRFSFDGTPMDLGTVRQRLAALPTGVPVHFRVQIPGFAGYDRAEQLRRKNDSVDVLLRMAAELGLKASARIESTLKE